MTTATVKGIDVSHYQGTVNWPKVKAAGIKFAFAKATEGMTWIDPQLVTNWAGMKNAGLVLCLGSMLHSIATGNMLPSWVKIVCVDINPAVVTKVSDRGTGQAVGVVSDVGMFLDLLLKALP